MKIEMISKEKIVEIVENKIVNDGYFIVEIDVSASNNIKVFIDANNGVSIDYCIDISRLIEQSLDREVEDFSLEVSSPGVGQPFKVLPQYQKNLGKEVQLVTKLGEKIKGILTNASNIDFVVTQEKKVKIDGSNKKENKIIEHLFTYEEVKTVSETINF